MIAHLSSAQPFELLLKLVVLSHFLLLLACDNSSSSHCLLTHCLLTLCLLLLQPSLLPACDRLLLRLFLLKRPKCSMFFACGCWYLHMPSRSPAGTTIRAADPRSSTSPPPLLHVCLRLVSCFSIRTYDLRCCCFTLLTRTLYTSLVWSFMVAG